MPCRLCGEPKVYDINSHFTPRAISETTFGKVEKEEIHTIDLKYGTIEAYYGRAHPKSQANIIKPLPNTAKGIFCKKCENGFGLLESICQPLLAKAIIDLQNGVLVTTKIEKGLVAFTLPINPNIFNLFFLSVIWRQCVLNEIEVGEQVLSQKDFGHLQNSILSEIQKSKKEIEKSTNFDTYPLVTVFTAPGRVNTASFINPTGLITNPELFFVGDYSCLFFKNAPITPQLFKINGIPYGLQQLSGDKSAHTVSRIILIDEYHYNKIYQHAIDHSVYMFFKEHIQKISIYHGVGPLTAEYQLKQLAMRFYIQNGMREYTKCLLKASQALCA